MKNSSVEVGFGQNGITEINSFKSSTTKVSFTEIGLSQISENYGIGLFQKSTEVGITQLGLSQVSSSKNNSTQISTTQINTTEISFSSSIASEQFFSSHNTSPTSIYDINNTALTLWNSYLQTSTPLNLGIEIVDLPSGQLAEASITGFDPTGRPNAGTLYLDIDANGLDWYIDSTPWDNSEYSQTLTDTDTAYRATADSAAYGHYDLLTTILHETAHLQGFISG
jgi:hypothetical protein